jgi:hypothetical protein
LAIYCIHAHRSLRTTWLSNQPIKLMALLDEPSQREATRNDLLSTQPAGNASLQEGCVQRLRSSNQALRYTILGLVKLHVYRICDGQWNCAIWTPDGNSRWNDAAQRYAHVRVGHAMESAL